MNYSRVKGTANAPKRDVDARKWQQEVNSWNAGKEWCEAQIAEGKMVEENKKQLKFINRKLARLMLNNPFGTAE
jgi:hypothetical protein